jgi:hypothetical protein
MAEGESFDPKIHMKGVGLSFEEAIMSCLSADTSIDLSENSGMRSSRLQALERIIKVP